MNDEIQQHFLTLYQREFPQREQVRILDYTSISTGWESDLFSVQLDYEEAALKRSEEVILKLYHGDSGTLKAEREFYSLRQLALRHYPVPGALFAALEESPFGRACVVMEKIQGRTVAEVFDASSKEKQRELVTQCCQLYVDLHKLDWKSFVPDPARYQANDLVSSRLAEGRTIVNQWLPGVFDPALDWLYQRSEEVVCRHASVLHGDFHINNLLLRDDGVMFVIDWTAMDVSDYRFDLAWTLLLLGTLYSTDLRDAVLEKYEQLAGHAIEHMEFFDVFSCLRRLFDITVSLNSGAVTRGMKPGAEEQMRKNTNHMQLVYAQFQERTGCSLPEIEKLILSLS